ncbi:MAG: transposase [Fusobacteriaceae bacterium]
MTVDLNSLFKDMVKDVIKQCYKTEIEEKLSYLKYDSRNGYSKNYRNGYTEKTLKAGNDSIEVRVT